MSEINNKSQEEYTIDLYKTSFEYTKDRHNLLFTTISDIRNVSNYIVTGVIAFTSFIITTDKAEFLSTNFQKSIFFGLLILIIINWLVIIWSIKISLGLEIVKVIDLVKQFNSEDFNEVKIREKIKSSNPKIAIYEYLLKRKYEEYEKAEKTVSEKLELKKKFLLTLSGVFFLVSVLFIIRPEINLVFF